MHYQTTIRLNSTPTEVFRALTEDIDKWWGRIDHAPRGKGDAFSVFFGKTQWRFLVTAYDPYNAITWQCTHAHHEIAELERTDEWFQTELYWDIEPKTDGAEVNLLHQGLIPKLSCYTICESGWNYFLETSLKNYLETGVGNPRYE